MSGAPADSRRDMLASRFVVLALGGLFLLGLLGFVVAVLGAEEGRGTPRRSGQPGASDGSRGDKVGQPQGAAPRIILALAEAPAAEAPAADAPVTPMAAPGEAAVPVVPVARFWARQEGLSRRDVVRALESGRLRGYRRVIVEDVIAEPLAALLGVDLHKDVRRGGPASVRAVVRRGGLGFVRATALEPSFRALRVEGRSLLGNERVADVSKWPLVLALAPPDGRGWDQARTWVLVAGGDSFTDRGVYDTVVRKGRGVDFPFGGGRARVTGHACCDRVFGDNVVPIYELTGDAGAVRRLVRDADIAIANHEQPVTDDWAFHGGGLRFSGKPELTSIFTRAGIDWLSLANNHIGDYGSEGIADSLRILRRHGIAHGGAGRDLARARRVSYLDTAGARVALIACLDIVKAYWAGPGKSGATPCLDRYLVPDIKTAARKADVVVVFPHWGVEYTRQPLPSMRKHAARWIKAGADLVLGSHSHVAGAIEDFEGVPAVYSLGNLIFDQDWSTNTMESVLLEATFQGDRLVGMRLHPYVIHARSQPNLLDPARGEGRRLLRQVRAASAGRLDW